MRTTKRRNNFPVPINTLSSARKIAFVGYSSKWVIFSGLSNDSVQIVDAFPRRQIAQIENERRFGETESRPMFQFLNDGILEEAFD